VAASRAVAATAMVRRTRELMLTPNQVFVVRTSALISSARVAWSTTPSIAS
jgi:hypothetical protein